ncbi:MAG: ABC transporter substrate-binding protein [Candidatus Hodarchaeales archaeon]
MIIKKFCSIFLAIVILAGFFGTSGFRINGSVSSIENVNAVTGTVKVGVLVPQTGALSFIAPGILDGIKTAAFEVNASSEFPFNIELVVRDTGSSPSQAITAYNELNSSGTELIIGPTGSTVAMSVVDLAQQDQNVLISYSTTSPSLSNASLDFFFRTIPSDANQSEGLASLLNYLTHQNIVVVHQNDDYGNWSADSFVSLFTGLGGNVLTQLSFAVGTVDFSSIISSINAQSSADGVVLISFNTEGELFVTQARSNGMNLPLYTSDAIDQNNLASVPEAELITGIKTIGGVPGVGRYDQFLTILTDCNTAGVCTAGNIPGIFADYAYDAMYVGALAINKSTTYDGAIIKSNMAAAGASFIGATGNKTFSSLGDPLFGTYEFWQIHNAQVHPVGTFSSITGVLLNDQFIRQYKPHAPIFITSNAQLNASFPGMGTLNDPVRIEGYNITSSSGILISISGTTFYFRIANNYLDGLMTSDLGIQLSNVINGRIENNSVNNNSGMGINIINGSQNNTILNNTVINHNQGDYGINLWNSNYNLVESNTLFNNSGGIQLDNSNNNFVINNSIFDGFQALNFYFGSNNNTFTDNAIFSHDFGFVVDSNNNTIANNAIYDNDINFINGNNNNFTNNVFYNNYNPNDPAGIRISPGASGNIFARNDFSQNSIDFSQVDDSGTNTLFLNNYWSDWTGTGAYSIQGDTGNQDSSPLLNPFHLSVPVIIIPTTDNLTLSDIVLMQWDVSSDSVDHPLTYSIFYSTNDGSSWIELVSDLTLTNYPLDTNTFSDGTQILFRVHTVDSVGFIAKGTSLGTFLIANSLHQLTSPVLSSPLGGSNLTGQVDIRWSPAVDSWNHGVVYDIYYSPDEGTTWISLISDLSSASYTWDTTTVDDGLSYQIKVVATCLLGLTSEDVTDGTFIIKNLSPTSTSPTSTSPTSTSPTSTSIPSSTTSLTTTSGLTGFVFFLTILIFLFIRKKKTVQ